MKKIIFILVMAVVMVGLNNTCSAYNIGDDPGNPVPDDDYVNMPTGYPGEPFEIPANQAVGQGEDGTGLDNAGGAPDVSMQDIIDDAAAKAYKKAYDDTMKQQWANPEDAKKHADAAAAEAANAAVGGAKAGGLIDSQGNTTSKGAAVVAQAQAYVNQVYQALLSNFMAQFSPQGGAGGQAAGGGPGQQPGGGADLNTIGDGVGLTPGQFNMPPAGQPAMKVTAYQILASGIPVGFYAPGEKVNISELSITYANRPGEVVSIVWGKVKDKDQWVPVSFTANAALANNQPGELKAQVNYVNLTSDQSGGMSGVVQNPIAAYNTNSKNGGSVVVDGGWELTYAGKVETKKTQDGATISYITLTSADAGHANYNGKTFITSVTKGQYNATFGNALEPQPGSKTNVIESGGLTVPQEINNLLILKNVAANFVDSKGQKPQLETFVKVMQTAVDLYASRTDMTTQEKYDAVMRDTILMFDNDHDLPAAIELYQKFKGYTGPIPMFNADIIPNAGQRVNDLLAYNGGQYSGTFRAVDGGKLKFAKPGYDYASEYDDETAAQKANPNFVSDQNYHVGIYIWAAYATKNADGNSRGMWAHEFNPDGGGPQDYDLGVAGLALGIFIREGRDRGDLDMLKMIPSVVGAALSKEPTKYNSNQQEINYIKYFTHGGTGNMLVDGINAFAIMKDKFTSSISSGRWQ